MRLEPLQSGGGQERGLRSGTVPTPLTVGLGAACQLAGEEMEVRPRQIVAGANAPHFYATYVFRCYFNKQGRKQLKWQLRIHVGIDIRLLFTHTCTILSYVMYFFVV